MIIWLIREAQKAWKERNEEVHNAGERISKSDQEVQNIYSLADEMSHHDKEMLEEPLELQKPIQTLRQWVGNTPPTAKTCITEFIGK